MMYFIIMMFIIFIIIYMLPYFLKEKIPENDPCEFPNCRKKGKLRRQNTFYQKEDLNYSYYCEEHQKEVDEIRQEMRREYYSER